MGAGDGFLQAFAAHFQALMKRGRASAPSCERAQVAAVFAEVVKELKGAAAPCGQHLLPLCLREMAAVGSSDCRRNSAYCAGLLAEHCGAWAPWGAPQLTQAFCALLSDSEADDGVRDNAAAAALRLVSSAAAAPSGASGLSTEAERELLLAVCSALPIEDDFQVRPRAAAQLLRELQLTRNVQGRARVPCHTPEIAHPPRRLAGGGACLFAALRAPPIGEGNDPAAHSEATAGFRGGKARQAESLL